MPTVLALILRFCYALIRMTVLSTLRHTWTQPHCTLGECWFNAAYNKFIYEKKTGKTLRWVIGGRVRTYDKGKNHYQGFGFCRANGEYVLNDLLGTNTLVSAWNCSHAWLEDDEGNVYDYSLPEENEFLNNNRPMPLWSVPDGMIEGVPKHILKQQGYDFYPFSHTAQCILIAVILSKNPNGFPDRIAALDVLRAATVLSHPQSLLVDIRYKKKA